MPRKAPFNDDKPTNIVITGGAQGIGLELAKLFIERSPRMGVHLFLVDIRADLLAELQLDENKNKVTAIVADLGNEEDLEKAWIQIISKCNGQVHILVNNAARVQGKRFSEMSIADFKQSISVNLVAYVHLTKLFLS